jgi:RNA polymerase sigma factor (sigma-70 family)
MKKIEKINEYVELFDLYKNLLTESQRETFEMYYFEDYTLQEIAEQKGISKNAVHDSIKKTENALLDYENKIQFLKYKNEQK